MPNFISDIANNPFRILDVYIDAGQKEMLAKKGKMSALVSVGQSVKRNLCMPGVFLELNCSAADINDAYKQLYIPQNKVQYAMMWFMRPEDEVLNDALMNCSGRDVKRVLSRFRKFRRSLGKGKEAPLWLLQDLILLCLLADDYKDVYSYVSKLSLRVDEWLKLIGCEVVSLDSGGMVQLFGKIMERNGISIDIEGKIREAYDRLVQKIGSMQGSMMTINLLYRESLNSLPVLKMAPKVFDHYYLDIANRVAETLIDNCLYHLKHYIDCTPETEMQIEKIEQIGKIAAYAESIMYGTSLLPKLNELKKEICEKPKKLKEKSRKHKIRDMVLRCVGLIFVYAFIVYGVFTCRERYNHHDLYTEPVMEDTSDEIIDSARLREIVSDAFSDFVDTTENE